MLIALLMAAATGDPVAAAVRAGDFPATTSVLVAHRDEVVYERYFGDGGAGVLNDTRSAMKTVTALAIGAAIDDGLIPSVDAPAFAYLTVHEPFADDGPAKRAITIEDFLTMSSALDCDDWDMASPGNEENMHPLPEWTRFAVDIPIERDAAPGRFSYCTAGVFLLGQVLERATGSPPDRFIERRVLAPMGITNTQWPRSGAGEVMTGGGLRLSSRDLLKVGQLLMARGGWNGRQLVPSAWIDSMLTARRRVDDSQAYGYLTWHRDDYWFMSGNGGNVVVVVPEQELVIVITRTHYNQRDMHRQTGSLIDLVRRAWSSCRLSST